MPHDEDFLPVPGFPGYAVARDLRVMGPRRKALTVYPSNGCVSVVKEDGAKTQRTPAALLKLALGISCEKETEPEKPGSPGVQEKREAEPAGKTGVPDRPAYFKTMRQNEELWRENADLREEIAFLHNKLAHNDAIILNLAGRIMLETVETAS